MKRLTGLNIQWPWSQLIVQGKKTVETRSYPLPERLRGVEIAIIETPGPMGKTIVGKARIIGTVIFSHSKQYRNRSEWREDYTRHCVPSNEPTYRYTPGKDKHGWVISKVTQLDSPVSPPKKRGRVFALNCKITA